MADGLNIFIITGLSGSGKSVAIHALEDNGFFCIDNLPALLIPKFIDLARVSRRSKDRPRRFKGGQFWNHGEVLTRCAPQNRQVLF
jgi:UPF0042 nucleotide-binding protein